MTISDTESQVSAACHLSFTSARSSRQSCLVAECDNPPVDPNTTTIVVAAITGVAGVVGALGATALNGRGSRKAASSAADRARIEATYDERRELYASFFALAGRLEAQAQAARYEGGIPNPERSNHQEWELVQARLRLLAPAATFGTLDEYATGVGMLWNVGWAGWNPEHPLYEPSMARLEVLGMGSPDGLDRRRGGAFEIAAQDLESLRRWSSA